MDWFAGEVAAEHRASAIELHRNIRAACYLSHAFFEFRASCFERGINIRSCEAFQSRQSRRHRKRIATQRAGLVDRSERRQSVHDFAAPTESAHGQSAADDFAETCEVGRDSEAGLRAAEPKAKAGHHFIEDQERSVFFG